MASSGKATAIKRSSTGFEAPHSNLLRLALPPATPQISAAVLTSMGLDSLPPVISRPFGWLKSLELDNVGKGLKEVLTGSGWELVPWRPTKNLVESGSGLSFEDGDLGVGAAVWLFLGLRKNP